MEFKKGDIVVCIDNSGYNTLKLNKQYIVTYCYKSESYPDEFIVQLNEFGIERMLSKRFILDKAYYRKQKLKQLRNEI